MRGHEVKFPSREEGPYTLTAEVRAGRVTQLIIDIPEGYSVPTQPLLRACSVRTMAAESARDIPLTGNRLVNESERKARLLPSQYQEIFDSIEKLFWKHEKETPQTRNRKIAEHLIAKGLVPKPRTTHERSELKERIRTWMTSMRQRGQLPSDKARRAQAG